MTEFIIVLAGVPAGIWVYLLLFRGGFWRERPWPPVAMAGGSWPEVVAIVPARNEAGIVGRAVRSLVNQDYAGRFSIILVDDNSADATIAEARDAAAGGRHPLSVVKGRSLPEGWMGKLWAVHQGLAEARRRAPMARYLLLTDADIAHGPNSLAGLVARAQAGRFSLVSLMARLKVDTFAERALVPAYIFFFQKLYPFAWVRDPKHATAAAAGGCMLVERAAFGRIGEIASIRHALIDDCALGLALKKEGPIWLGLGEDVASLRGYPAWRDLWNLIARSAFTQLRHSNTLLALTLIGMGLTYLAPPLFALSHDPGIRPFGFIAWALMSLAYVPTLSYHRLSPLWAPFLPCIALFYSAATFASAWRYWRGQGGQWKGRAQALSTRTGDRSPRGRA